MKGPSLVGIVWGEGDAEVPTSMFQGVLRMRPFCVPLAAMAMATRE
ncbi:hypothetical protein MYXA107069_23930 [Myxococcus xanthus]|nr:hypothetical protein MyxoNM_19120 [Myxococcus xanthus]SDY15978.1 hypothetical protein SAMN05444383_1215 [Myxococcus xanthus]